MNYTNNMPMKRFVKYTTLTFVFAMMLNFSAIAQGPPLPPGHGENNDVPAPIGSGIAVLLMLAGAYGAKKVYDARKKLSE